LVVLLRSPTPDLRQAGAAALLKLGAAREVAAVPELLADPDAEVRRVARWAKEQLSTLPLREKTSVSKQNYI